MRLYIQNQIKNLALKGYGYKRIADILDTMGKAYCPSKQIPENTLISITEEVLGSTDTLYDKITAIRAEKDNTLV